MNIQELKDFFIKSDFSDGTKSVIASILSDKTEVTPGLVAQVKDVLQKELDADFKEMGVDTTNDVEAQKVEQEYMNELNTIEKDLNSDMDFVEKELGELEETRKQVLKISDEMEADVIKQSI